MKNLTRGILITLEGIDGCGKSTAARELAAHFQNMQLPVVLTKEPGATPLGQIIRTIVQEKKVPRCPEAEFLLFATDRAQHFAQIVLPALAEQKIIISDRMADSSVAYQGYGRGLDRTLIEKVNKWVMHNKEPDFALYLRVSPDVSLARIAQRNVQLTAFEQEKQDFLYRLYHGFEEIFAQKNNGRIIDAEQPLEMVIENIISVVETWLNSQNIIRS
jgi:dTMP kinase